MTTEARAPAAIAPTRRPWLTDTALVRADAEALSTAFPEIEQALADNQTSFAREGFTADELWFLTV